MGALKGASNGGVRRVGRVKALFLHSREAVRLDTHSSTNYLEQIQWCMTGSSPYYLAKELWSFDEFVHKNAWRWIDHGAAVKEKRWRKIG